MFCSHCGTENPSTHKKCSHCGQELLDSQRGRLEIGDVGLIKDSIILNFSLQSGNRQEYQHFIKAINSLLSKVGISPLLMEPDSSIDLNLSQIKELEQWSQKVTEGEEKFGSVLDQGQVYMRLGNLELSSHNYQRAEEFYLKALEHIPSCPEAHFNLYQVYLARSQFQEAMRHYQEAIFLKKGLSVVPGRYQLTEILGKGGMGVVFKAQDLILNETLAIKALKPELSKNNWAIERFKEEVKIAHSFAHENIGKVYHLEEQDKKYCIAMEYIEGKDLRQVLRERETFPLQEALKVMDSLCHALSYIHQRNFFHGDLKPSNILLKNQEQVKVVDIGLAQLLAPQQYISLAHSSGTFNYMAPEQRASSNWAQVDGRCDIYSLGVILYEMLTGQLPGFGLKMPSELNPGIPRKIDSMVLACMEREPANRYQSVEELHGDIESLIEGAGGRDGKETHPLPKRKIRPSPALALVILLLALLFLLPLSRRGQGDRFSCRARFDTPQKLVKTEDQSSHRDIRAERARTLMSEAKEMAQNHQADLYASDLFTLAMQKEQEAHHHLSEEEINLATLLFFQAKNFFDRAREEAQALIERQRESDSTADAWKRADKALSSMKKAKEEAQRFNASRYASELFTLGQSQEERGQGRLSDHNYSMALRDFQKAEKNYLKACQKARDATLWEESKQSSLKAKEDMLLALRMAREAEAPYYAQDLFEKAMEKLMEAERLFENEEFLEASDASLRAINLFSAAQALASAKKAQWLTLTEKEEAERAYAFQLAEVNFTGARHWSQRDQSQYSRRHFPQGVTLCSSEESEEKARSRALFRERPRMEQEGFRGEERRHEGLSFSQSRISRPSSFRTQSSMNFCSPSPRAPFVHSSRMITNGRFSYFRR